MGRAHARFISSIAPSTGKTEVFSTTPSKERKKKKERKLRGCYIFFPRASRSANAMLRKMDDSQAYYVIATPCMFSATLCRFASPPLSFEALTEADVTSCNAVRVFLGEPRSCQLSSSSFALGLNDSRHDAPISRPLHLRWLVRSSVLQWAGGPDRHAHSPRHVGLGIDEITPWGDCSSGCWWLLWW